MYLKMVILLLLGTILTTVSSAQQRLYVHNLEGRQQSYILSRIRKLTFPGENMAISFKNTPSKDYLIDNIQFCNFRYIPSWQEVDEPGIVYNIYPNPTDNELIIESSEEISEITLHDVLGRELMHIFPESADALLQLSSYASGLYVLQLFTTNHLIAKKIIKY